MNLAKKIARSAGYELIRKRQVNDSLEQHLSNVLKALKINLLIDIGANCGQFASMVRRVGFKGRIVSVEPQPEQIRMLNEASKDDAQWWVEPIGMGSVPAQLDLNIYSSAVFTSFLPPSEYGKSRYRRSLTAKEVVKVDVDTLSNRIGKYTDGIKNPRVYLKSDTQGFDLEVLAGASDAMSLIVGMQLEMPIGTIYEGMPNHLDMLQKIHELGFTPSGIYPISHSSDGLRVLECDVVALRNDQA